MKIIAWITLSLIGIAAHAVVLSFGYLLGGWDAVKSFMFLAFLFLAVMSAALAIQSALSVIGKP